MNVFFTEECLQEDLENAYLSLQQHHGFLVHLSLGFGFTRCNPVRNTGFYEDTVPSYSDVTFRSHFRMKRSTFEDLCLLLAPVLPERCIPVEKKVLATLWLLGNQESFRSVADRFDLSKSSLHQVILGVSHAIADLSSTYIRWPNAEEMRANAEKFSLRCGFPGVVGAIDGTHVPIPGPSDHRDSYINRKGFPSIHLQAVCNSDLQFIDIYAGWPGSVHDGRVFRNSPLRRHLETNMPSDLHLLGDSAYPLMPLLLVPFRDNGQLTAVEKKYNKCHSSTRVEIERTFGLLKSKFRRLHYLDMRLLDQIPIIISATCVLHNFILAKQNLDDEDIPELDQDVPQPLDNEPMDANIQAAHEKRMEVALSLM